MNFKAILKSFGQIFSELNNLIVIFDLIRNVQFQFLQLTF